MLLLFFVVYSVELDLFDVVVFFQPKGVYALVDAQAGAGSDTLKISLVEAAHATTCPVVIIIIIYILYYFFINIVIIFLLLWFVVIKGVFVNIMLLLLLLLLLSLFSGFASCTTELPLLLLAIL